MTKRIRSKHKIDRRLGVNLWGRPKSPINKRDSGPGQHGKRRGKKTEYGTQLSEKQKLKGYYGELTEKQFRRYYADAIRRKGDSAENLIESLERRLDAVVYRMKLVASPFAARQFVNHGHIRVNGRRVNIPSYSVRDGDIIEVKDTSRELSIVLDALNSSERDLPDYISCEDNGMKGTFVRGPKLAEVPYPVQMQPKLVIEFYSR